MSKPKKRLKLSGPKRRIIVANKYLGFKYNGNKGVLSLSKILTREMTIQKVMTTGAVTSIPVNTSSF